MNLLDRSKLYGFVGIGQLVTFEDFKPIIGAVLAIVLDFLYSFGRKKIKEFNRKK